KGSAHGTSSNVNGYFVLVNVAAGLCTLRAQHIGYHPLDFAVQVRPGQEALTLKLRQTVLQSEEIVVTAENLQTMEVTAEPAQVRLSPRQIASLPALGEADIFRALQLLPGISGVNDGSSGLYIRGGTPDENHVLFDGMTIYHVDHLFGFISAFNPEAVKDVRVFKGGFPAKFGGRTASVIELTGKSGSFDDFNASGSVNLLSGSGTTQIPLGHRGAWLLSFRRSYMDVIKSDLYNKIYASLTGKNNTSGSTAETPAAPGPGGRGGIGTRAVTITPDFYYYDLNSKLSFSVSQRDLFSLSFYNGKDNLDRSQDLGAVQFRQGNPLGGPANTNVTVNDVTKWGNVGASTKWARVWSDRFYSNFLAAYSSYSSSSNRGLNTGADNQNTLRRAFSSQEENEVQDLTLQFDHEWQATAAHRIEFGAQRVRTEVDVRFASNDTITILRRNDQANQTSLYLQDQWKMFSPFEMTFGVRATNYAPLKENYFEPRLSFKWFLHKNLWLKGAYGEYHQFVNRITNENVLEGNRDFWALSNAHLPPTVARHQIFGASYENRDYLFDVEAYYKDLDNVAEFSQRFRRSPEDPVENLFFVGRGYAKGIEFLAQKKFGKINGWASYTLGKVEYTIAPFNNGAPFPANQDRRHEVKLVGNYKLGKWNLAGTWVYATGAPYTAPENQYNIALLDGSTRSFIHVGDKNAQRLSTYHRMDVSLSRQFESSAVNWDLGLSVFNLYNHKNVWYREYRLDTSPVIVNDIVTLGFTPTVTLKVELK
ncbi:MAG: TonB-dependent receptor, partial [candidate division KSB1 bacterium]